MLKVTFHMVSAGLPRSSCGFGVHAAVGFIHQRAEPLGVRGGAGGSAQRTHILVQIRARHVPIAVFKVVRGEHYLSLTIMFAETAKLPLGRGAGALAGSRAPFLPRLWRARARRAAWRLLERGGWFPLAVAWPLFRPLHSPDLVS